MNQPNIGPKLWSAMETHFRDWVRRDRFNGDYPSSKPRFCKSVRELSQKLAAALMQHPDSLGPGVRVDVDQPLATVLAQPYRTSRNTGGTLTDLVVTGLCLPSVAQLLLDLRVADDSTVNEWLQEHGVTTYAGLTEKMTHPATEMELALKLAEVFWAETGTEKTVRDYFMQSQNEWGYTSWWPDAFTNCGTVLKDRVIEVPGGTVTTRAVRYDEVSSRVRPYEWSAALHVDAHDPTPAAIACGMVYVLAREDGVARCSLSDLRWASDAVSDTDVSQMMAFLKQNPDAPDLMQLGDICFIWLWERKTGSAKGLGALCLQAALSDLKKRYRRLKTLVVNVEPAQFKKALEAADPPQIQEAKRAALANTNGYLAQLQPQLAFGKDAELRIISTAFLSPHKTMMELGLADLADAGAID